MSVALYMDHHVPAAVTAGLRQRGVSVLTTVEDDSAEWEDEQILDRATQLDRTFYTQDDDFLAIARQWQASSREHAGIVYAHQQSITIGEAIADLELIAKAMDAIDLRNQVVFIPFR